MLKIMDIIIVNQKIQGKIVKHKDSYNFVKNRVVFFKGHNELSMNLNFSILIKLKRQY